MRHPSRLGLGIEHQGPPNDRSLPREALVDDVGKQSDRDASGVTQDETFRRCR